MGSISLWQSELQKLNLPPITATSLPTPCQTDITIIGAGITGSTIALQLARAGAEVRVLESRHIAAGASGRNAGFITTGAIEPYSLLIAHHGRERAQRIWTFHNNNYTLATKLIEELKEQNWDCEYRRNGSLALAASESELNTITATATLLNADGWPVKLLQQNDLPARLRPTYYGGSYCPRDGELHPAKFVIGLARLAQQAGVIFHEQTPITSIIENENEIILNTPHDTIHAHTLILATNAWLPELGVQLGANWLAQCITPTRGQIIATEPINEQLFPCPCHANEGYQYWRQLSDGRLIIGGERNISFQTETTKDESISKGIQNHLDAFVHKKLHLPETRIISRWAGIMAFSADGLPLIGRLPNKQSCYIAGGYTGHGNATAIQAAHIVSELILGRTHPEADLFDPVRFADEPDVDFEFGG